MKQVIARYICDLCESREERFASDSPPPGWFQPPDDDSAWYCPRHLVMLGGSTYEPLEIATRLRDRGGLDMPSIRRVLGLPSRSETDR